MAKRTKLDEKHHVLRNVGSRKYRKAGDELVVFPAAFRLRLRSEFAPPKKEDEKYISVSWVEYFDGSLLERVKNILATIRKIRGVNKSTALVVLNVGKIIACGKRSNTDLTVWHEPKLLNQAYGAVRGMRLNHQDNDRLPTSILAEAVTDTFMVSDLK